MQQVSPTFAAAAPDRARSLVAIALAILAGALAEMLPAAPIPRPFSAVLDEGARIVAPRARTFPRAVELRWSVRRAIDNVGFHVLREEGGGRLERVSARLVAGSALLASDDAGGAPPLELSWTDPRGRDGDRYWLEDHARDGTIRRHGPLVAHPLPATDLDDPRPNSARLSADPTIAFPEPAPAAWFADATPAPPTATTDRIARKQALRIEVDREGIHAIPASAWFDAGLSRTIDPTRLQLFFRGEEVAIEVEGEADRSFDPGDRVLFLGRAIDTPHTGIAVYWLVVGEAPGARWPTIDPPNRTGSPIESHRHTIESSEVSQYFAALRNGPETNLVGELIALDPVERFVEIRHRDETSFDPVTLEVELQGIGAVEHEILVEVNGVEVGRCLFTGTERSRTRFTLPPLLVAPMLEVSLASARPEAFCFITSVGVTYPRLPVASSSFLRGTAPGGRRLLISRARPGSVLLDLTEPHRVARLATDEVPIPGGPTVALAANLTAGPERVWGLLSPGGAIAPRASTGHFPLSPEERLESSFGADPRAPVDAVFVIVAPHDWISALAPLIALRRAEGLSTAAFALEEIFDTWNAGMVDPRALRSFLEAAHAGRSPTHSVLLVGDGNYDPRARIEGSAASYLPVPRVDGTRGETASDAWFGDFDRDGRPELAIGRLPARSAEEVAEYVARVVAFERSREPRATCATDSAPPRACFEAIATVDTRAGTIDEVQRALGRALAGASPIVAVLGRGGARWRIDDLLGTCLLETSAPFLIAPGSRAGVFHHRTAEGLGESVLRRRNGPIALLGSSDPDQPLHSEESTTALLSRFAADPSLSLGAALLTVQRELTPSAARTLILLGDPTLRP